VRRTRGNARFSTAGARRRRLCRVETSDRRWVCFVCFRRWRVGVFGDVGGDFAVWADVAAVERSAGCLGEAKRQLEEVGRVLCCVVGFGEVGEVVHASEHAAVRGLCELVTAHLGDLPGDEFFAETEGGEDRRCGLCHPLDDRCGGGQWHEEGQSRRVVDEEGHLRLPEQHGGVPGAQNVRRRLSV